MLFKGSRESKNKNDTTKFLAIFLSKKLSTLQNALILIFIGEAKVGKRLVGCNKNEKI